MPLGTPYIPDTITDVANGVHAARTAAAFSAAHPGVTLTPSASFRFHYNGHLLTFTKNVPFITDAKLTAALTAAGAPVA
jgi:hypothetical protein